MFVPKPNMAYDFQEIGSHGVAAGDVDNCVASVLVGGPMILRPCWFVLGCLVFAYNMAIGQEVLVGEIEGALQAKPHEVVYDFGHLLKPAGVTELRQLEEGFRADGLHFYFITVPPGSMDVGGLAESVYRDLQMTANDVLLIFDSTRVYGKTLALKGEPQAFADALRAAQPGFRLYHAKGLALFAQSLHDRIVQRRAHEIAQQHATIERQRLLWGGVAVLLVAAVSIVAYRQWQRRSVVRQQYDNRLKEAELLFQQVAVNMPLGGLSLQEITPAHVDGAPHDMASAFLQLEGELRRCQQRSGTTLTDVDRLIADLQKLNKQLGPT
jgi:hypothetical protein